MIRVEEEPIEDGEKKLQEETTIKVRSIASKDKEEEFSRRIQYKEAKRKG